MIDFQGLSHRGAEDGELSVLQPATPARGELELAAPRQPQVHIVQHTTQQGIQLHC